MEDAPPSLMQRLMRAPALRGRRAGVAAAVLIAAGPGMVAGGAFVLAQRERAATPVVSADMRARAAAARDRAALADRPAATATLAAVARALPPGAVLSRAERVADGALSLVVAAPDPDRLRAALRREPATAGLRDVGQVRGDGGIMVTLAERR